MTDVDPDTAPQIQELDINLHMLKMAIDPTYAAEFRRATKPTNPMQEIAQIEAAWQEM